MAVSDYMRLNTQQNGISSLVVKGGEAINKSALMTGVNTQLNDYTVGIFTGAKYENGSVSFGRTYSTASGNSKYVGITTNGGLADGGFVSIDRSDAIYTNKAELVGNREIDMLANQALFKAGAAEVSKFLSRTSYSAVGANNGGSYAITTKGSVTYGAGITYSESGIGGNINVSYERRTDNMIPISGFKVGATLNTSSIGSIYAQKTIGVNTFNITSDKANSVEVGVGISALGFPTVKAQVNYLSNGYLRKVDFGAMGNVINPIGAIMALRDAFSPQKVDIPRFEPLRVDDKPRMDAHFEIFDKGQNVINRLGEKQLMNLVENFKGILKHDPNAKLELGNYFDTYKDSIFSDKDNEVSVARQKAVLDFLKQQGIGEENIQIGQSKIDANDKRLNLLDNNTNIKIATSVQSLQLFDTGTQNISHFNALRSSPLGEQAYKDFLQRPEIVEFLNKNGKDVIEKEIVSNVLFDAIMIQKQDLRATLDEIQKTVYDQGYDFRAAYTETPKDIQKKLLDSPELKIIKDVLKDSMNKLSDNYPHFKNVNEKTLNKELEAFGEFAAEHMLNNKAFHEQLKEMQRQNPTEPNSMDKVLGPLLHTYITTYLGQGVLRSNINDVKDNLFDRLKEFSKMNDKELNQIEDPNLKEAAIRLNKLGFEKQEYKKLAHILTTTAIQDGLLNGGNVDQIITTVFPSINNAIYNQGNTLMAESALRSGEIHQLRTNNDYVQDIHKSFKRQWNELDINEKSIQEIIDNNPDFQKYGMTGANTVKQLERIVREISVISSGGGSINKEVNELSLKDIAKLKEPPVKEVAEQALSMLKSGVHLDTIQDYFRVRNQVLQEPNGIAKFEAILQKSPELLKADMAMEDVLKGQVVGIGVSKYDLMRMREQEGVLTNNNMAQSSIGEMNYQINQNIAKEKPLVLFSEIQPRSDMGVVNHMINTKSNFADAAMSYVERLRQEQAEAEKVKADQQEVEVQPQNNEQKFTSAFEEPMNVNAAMQAAEMEKAKIEQEKQALEAQKMQMQQQNTGNNQLKHF